MKMSKLVGERFKEKPADCTLISHELLVRGGYMRHVANGIYIMRITIGAETTTWQIVKE